MRYSNFKVQVASMESFEIFSVDVKAKNAQKKIEKLIKEAHGEVQVTLTFDIDNCGSSSKEIKSYHNLSAILESPEEFIG